MAEMIRITATTSSSSISENPFRFLINSPEADAFECLKEMYALKRLRLFRRGRVTRGDYSPVSRQKYRNRKALSESPRGNFIASDNWS
jgi:hypothetical protein